MRVTAVAVSTFREAVRSRLFLLLGLFAGGLILFSKVMAMLVVGNNAKVVKDVGLAPMEIFISLLAVLSTVTLFFKERDRKTILNVLSKPLSREEFLVGKFLGLVFTTGVALFSLTLLFSLYLWPQEGGYPFDLWPHALLLFFQGAILTAWALLFSALSTPILSSLFTLGIYLSGYLTGTLLTHYGAIFKGSSRIALQALYFLLPNFSLLNWKNQIVYTSSIPTGELLNGLFYGINYTLAILVLAVILYRERDLLL